MKSWFEALMSQERRKAERKQTSELVAYFWDGATPVAHPVRDISSSGVYLVTEQRWYPGTLVQLTLQRTGTVNAKSDRSLLVQSKVVRSGPDGVGLSFILSGTPVVRREHDPVADVANKKTMDRFLRQISANPSPGPNGQRSLGIQAQPDRGGKS